MLVNGYDLTQLGLVVRAPDGWRDALQLVHRYTDLPGRVGHVPVSREQDVRPRPITLSGWMKAADVATLLTNTDALKARLYEGTLEVVFPDQTDRLFYALCNQVRVTPIAPAYAQPAHEVQVTLEAPDPQSYDVEPTIIAFSGSKAACPTGSGVSLPVIEIGGAVTDPVIIYRDHRGTEIARLELTVTLSTSEYLVIDCAAMTITDQSGASRISTLSDGDFLRIDGHDAVQGGSGPYPTLEVSPAPGVATARYRRAWL